MKHAVGLLADGSREELGGLAAGRSVEPGAPFLYLLDLAGWRD